MLFAPVVFFALFQFKHYFFDFHLQCGNKYMLGKFKPYPYFIWPLCLHAGVNGAGTFLTLNVFTTYLSLYFFPCIHNYFWQVLLLNFSLGIFDFITHCIIDRVKSSPKLLGRYKPDDKRFWLAIGLDQGCHQLIYLLTYLIYMSKIMSL